MNPGLARNPADPRERGDHAIRAQGNPSSDVALAPYLNEYVALRAEFLHRLNAQQRVEQLAFATVAAAVALGAAVRDSAEAVSGIAFVATLLFCLLILEFNSHREKITMIFGYFVERLYPRIRTSLGRSAPTLGRAPTPPPNKSATTTAMRNAPSAIASA